MLKKHIYRFAAICFVVLFTYSGLTQEVLRGEDARNRFSNVEIVRTSKHTTTPSYIKFIPGQELDRDSFKNWLKKNLKLNNAMGFELINVENDQLGHQHYRYRQTLNNVPIEHAVWIVHTKQDRVYAMNGLIYSELNNGSASMAESTALGNAITHVGANTYKWELSVEEEHLKRESGDPSATYYPKGELVYISKNGTFSSNSYRLAYKFNIYAHEPVSRAEIYVDAQSGEILFENEVFHNVDVAGTAQTAYSGSQPIITDSNSGVYRLRESGRGNGINTYDMNEGTTYGNAVDFTDADNNWNNVNADLDEYATDAHWGAEMTYDYYFLNHNRNSIDGNGFTLNSYVHYDVNYANAFWDGQRMTYGDGDGTNWSPLTALDIAGHEITHGLTNFTADLVYQAESGALNESFSDIFGTSVENYARPTNWNWLIGEDIGSALRSMNNPNAYGDPDTYFGNNWASLTGGDNGGVHTNSGVQNFWYYLLVEGGSGTNDNSDSYSVTGIGFGDASEIAFRNLTVYLTPNSDFADARFYSIQSATDLFGGCTPQVESCTNAWYAVGVGQPYVAGVTADMSAPVTQACSAPFSVGFSNLSMNGTSFQWDFGDGNTSTDLSPTHTYSSLGDYTIQLIADGGACGIDTTIWIDYIAIDTAFPCEVIMPTSGTANTQTACSGTIYDSGGASGDYGPNEDASITISPVGAATVDIDFTFFDVEAGQSGSCNYDYVQVYDGPSTASPLIDTYCNNNIPGVISSTGDAITIVFHSDPGVEDAGYIITWDCILPSVPPTADFTTNVDTTCNGEILFTDLSDNGPNQWLWDFGDGNTSTQQNPTHIYTSSGTYSVTLTATNGIGSDIITYTDIIYVDLPVAPATTGDDICENDMATLTASGTGGNLEWYDAFSGGNVVGSGSSFTTPPLTLTTSYYVEENIPGALQNLGPLDNTFGGGGFFNGNQHLIFDCTSPVTLKTVKVYADGAGDRYIELRNSAGVVLQSATVFIPNGEQIINLNFDLPVGTDLQLGTQANSNQALYRNSNGPSFPYTVGGGEVTITQSSPGTDYYYFFYDWEIQSPSCTSGRTEVIATVNPSMDATISSVPPLCSTDAPVSLTAAESGGTWTGTGMSGNSFDPAIAGVGTHTITYEITGTCGDIDMVDINVSDAYDATITPISTLCDNESSTFLTAVDGGGTWSGTGILNGNTGEFDPISAGIGTHSITYTISGSCGDSDMIDITVVEGVDATITSGSLYCDSDSIVTFTATDAGGSWSGTGVIDSSTGEFDPIAAGAGTHTVTYTISGTCSDSDNEDIVVLETPNTTIDPAGPFCRYWGTELLTAASPGGTWSADCGTCIDPLTGEFDPNLAGTGTWEVTYSISGDCPSTYTTTIDVGDCLGVDENTSQMSIYPNPTDNHIKVNTGQIQNGQIAVVDAVGKTVYQYTFTTSEFVIDISTHIASGMYFIQLKDKTGSVIEIEQLIIQ
ncbi:MAG: M4 family metallopeptidase [Crocinitomicaceae bacterium]